MYTVLDKQSFTTDTYIYRIICDTADELDADALAEEFEDAAPSSRCRQAGTSDMMEMSPSGEWKEMS